MYLLKKGNFGSVNKNVLQYIFCSIDSITSLRIRAFYVLKIIVIMVIKTSIYSSHMKSKHDDFKFPNTSSQFLAEISQPIMYLSLSLWDMLHPNQVTKISSSEDNYLHQSSFLSWGYVKTQTWRFPEDILWAALWSSPHVDNYSVSCEMLQKSL